VTAGSCTSDYLARVLTPRLAEANAGRELHVSSFVAAETA